MANTDHYTQTSTSITDHWYTRSITAIAVFGVYLELLLSITGLTVALVVGTAILLAPITALTLVIIVARSMTND